MSTVTEIETAIKKLGMAEQRLIARHLNQRLVKSPYRPETAARDEGIPFLAPFESAPAPRTSRARTAGRDS